ncbi:dihydropyrimidinase, partial [Streptomyces sp. NPDC127069]
MSTRTLIRGGLVVTASDELHADVLIEDGRGGGRAPPPPPRAAAGTAPRTIHPSGQYVKPGRGAAHTPK